MMSICPLCIAGAEERFFYRDAKVKVLGTKELKGHVVRLMVITNEHIPYAPLWLEKHMVDRLVEVGRLLYSGERKFVVMSPVNGTVRDHAHFVATDLDPAAEDFEQVLGTPWLRVVDVRAWEK